MENNKLFYSKIQLLFSLLYNGYLKDLRLFKAFLDVELSEFIPNSLKNKVRIYDDAPVLFFYEEKKPETLRTISAPHMISIMLQELILKEDDDLLILGAKSGYIATLAHKLAPNGKIVILEANPDIAKITSENLKKIDLNHNVKIIVKNPLDGMPESGPWQKILVTGAIKQQRIYPLLRQLDENAGVLFAPIGENLIQTYTQIIRIGDNYYGKKHLQVRFTPLITQMELGQLELITDLEDFEISINYTKDIFSELKLKPSENTESYEIKPSRIFLIFLEHIDKNINLLKKQESINQWMNCIDNFEVIIEILKSLDKSNEISADNIINSLNQIKTYNLIRKEINSNTELNVKAILNKKVEIIQKQMEELSKLRLLIRNDIDQLKGK
ncbi:MAG: protein-L-isoaspartate O-methyltransferase [Promethearchaeota archaeon]